jgi:hypothetical protein
MNISEIFQELKNRLKNQNEMVKYANLTLAKSFKLDETKNILQLFYSKDYLFIVQKLRTPESSELIEKILFDITGKNIKAKFEIN